MNWTLLQICVAVLLDRYFSKEKFETKRTKSPVNYISRCVSCGKIYASVFDSVMLEKKKQYLKIKHWELGKVQQLFKTLHAV